MKNLDDMDEEMLVGLKGTLESNISSPIEKLAHFAVLYLRNEVNARLGVLAEEKAKNTPDLTAQEAKPDTTTNSTDKATLKPNEVV